MSDDPIEICKECGGKVRKLVSSAGFTLKGSGWYKDGYASNKPHSSATSKEASSASVESKPTEPKKIESSSTNNNKETKS